MSGPDASCIARGGCLPEGNGGSRSTLLDHRIADLGVAGEVVSDRLANDAGAVPERDGDRRGLALAKQSSATARPSRSRRRRMSLPHRDTDCSPARQEEPTEMCVRPPASAVSVISERCRCRHRLRRHSRCPEAWTKDSRFNGATLGAVRGACTHRTFWRGGRGAEAWAECSDCDRCEQTESLPAVFSVRYVAGPERLTLADAEQLT